ncbi:radical SAM protein [Desulfonema magnum]|uniref:Radical SAM domain-containing protein n=1 Tax=Desulfonema magnum TaxID=45655 RepID=A0A975GQ78_9BACT|nr:CofH family radical SAM protein [Desulfonema magnum]QTA89771.1 Radical SAM domain-containing protein [Desulfonema magnum]
MSDYLLKTIQDKTLRTIAEKVVEGVPVNEADALCMLGTNHILELGLIANYLRRKLHKAHAFYGVNMNLNYTNICEIRCPLCAFSCDDGDEKAYTLSLEDIEKKVSEAVAFGIDEVHIVGGLNPRLKIEYFENMLTRIKQIKPDIFIVGFTATEYDYFAKLNNISVEEVFQRFIRAGLGALPGGGAEIFAADVRNTIAPRKISGKRWLEVMKIAHSMGLKTNATMLYNHIEKPADIADHLSQIRSLQDETNGFKAFVPLPYHDANTGIRAKRVTTTGFEDIRLYATSRIFLHNIPHLKALWMYLGEKMAQVLLSFGVDDIGSTYHDEKVVHAAGAKTPDYGTEPYLRNLIENAGMKPVRSASDYEPLGK